MENQYSDLPQRFYDSIELVRQCMERSTKVIHPFRVDVWSQQRQSFRTLTLMELTIQVG